MEGLTRLVSESMARHGFDRPLDYRRLHWSRWFRCESHHSLLFVPSKPGVFALAEEITHVATGASPVPRSEATAPQWDAVSNQHVQTPEAESRKPEVVSRRMLAVTQFFEDDDMAFVLDRMLSRQNPMQTRLISGRYFVRFVVIEDQAQRRTICNALNQWMVTAAEKVTGIGSHFATSLELTPASEYVAPLSAQQPLFAGATDAHVAADAACPEPSRRVPPPERGDTALGIIAGAPASHPSQTAPPLDSGAATNIHCPSPLPSGF